MMPHPLASAPNVPAILRRAFSRVSEQIVRTYDDASYGIINVSPHQCAETERAKHAAVIGRKSPLSGRTLVAVHIRQIGSAQA